MFLVFVRGGATKWYARTPSGEYAFGENQGLYEWRGGQLIRHTNADRQAASNGEMYTFNNSETNRRNFGDTHRRGLAEALSAVRMN